MAPLGDSSGGTSSDQEGGGGVATRGRRRGRLTPRRAISLWRLNQIGEGGVKRSRNEGGGYKKRLLAQWSSENKENEATMARQAAAAAEARRVLAAPASTYDYLMNLRHSWRGDSAQLDVAGGQVKRRRYPKLLSLDADGVPVASRSEVPQRRAAESGATMHERAVRVLRTELEKIQFQARERFSIRMNLRGRGKLEIWLTVDVGGVSKYAVEVAVGKLALDGRLLCGEVIGVRAALGAMSNEPLRILEALHTRVQSKDGMRNWAFIRSHLNAQHDQVAPPMRTPPESGTAYAPTLATVVAAADALEKRWAT